MNKSDTLTDRCVWLAVIATRLDKGFHFTCTELETQRKATIDVLVRFRSGDHVEKDELPKVMWCTDETNDRIDALPHLAKVSGFLTVSQDMKNVLEQFDLGDSTFTPVTLLHMDRETAYPGQHYFLHIPHRKPGFSPAHSRNYTPRLFDFQEHLGTVPRDVVDDDISVAPLAVGGTDIWYDLSLLFSLFFSDRLFTALKEAGLTDDLMAVRCPVPHLN